MLLLLLLLLLVVVLSRLPDCLQVDHTSKAIAHALSSAYPKTRYTVASKAMLKGHLYPPFFLGACVRVAVLVVGVGVVVVVVVVGVVVAVVVAATAAAVGRVRRFRRACASSCVSRPLSLARSLARWGVARRPAAALLSRLQQS